MSDRIESDRIESDLDAALQALADDVMQATPHPGTDLTARVLADAAAVSAAMRPAEERPAAPVAVGGGFSLREFFFGWAAGAAAAAALALIVGIGIGMQMDSDLPMVAADEDGAGEFFTADSGFLPDDLL